MCLAMCCRERKTAKARTAVKQSNQVPCTSIGADRLQRLVGAPQRRAEALGGEVAQVVRRGRALLRRLLLGRRAAAGAAVLRAGALGCGRAAAGGAVVGGGRLLLALQRVETKEEEADASLQPVGSSVLRE